MSSGQLVGGGFKNPIHGTEIVNGTIEAEKFYFDLRSDNYVALTSGWQIRRDTGDVEFNDGTFRGTITVLGGNVPIDYLTDGDLNATATIIAGGYIESDNYIVGTSGFHIDETTAEFNNGTFRGTVIVGAGSDVDWQYVDTTTNKVLDADIDGLGIAKLTSGDLGATATIIGGGWIESDNYVVGTSGFHIDDTTAEFNNGVFRGTIYASAGEFTGTITATSGELGDLDITGTLEVQTGGKIITNASGSGYLEIAGGTSSNYLKFYTEHADETTPPSAWVTNWGASGWSFVLSAGQDNPSVSQSQLILSGETFAGVVGYGASLATQYGDLNLGATAAGADVNITAGNDIVLTTTDASGDIFLNPNGDIEMSPGDDVLVTSGGLYAKGALSGPPYGQFLISGSNEEAIFRNDGSRMYFLIANSSGAVWNSLRPLSWDLTSGLIFLDGTNVGVRIGSTNDFNIYDGGGTRRMAASSSYTMLHNEDGNTRFWVNTNDMWLNGNTINLRKADSTVMFQITQPSSNQSRLVGPHSSMWYEHDYTNGWHQWYIASQEQMRLDDAGSSSALRILDGLTNVGNHETLRLDRGSGTILREIGYYSSYVKDPDTGKTLKHKIVPLTKRNQHWRRNWFMDLEPVKYDRVQPKGATKDRTRKGNYVQRELGFTIENLIEHTNLLTTKGSKVGGSPDEYALLAVTVDYVQHLENRVASLERRLNKAENPSKMIAA
ncbi:MAG: hypothetical protein GY771_05360 [bacterium]|nr:hypothetical protein [bacterium]